MRRRSVVSVADTCTGMVKGTCPWTPAGIPAVSKRKRQLLEENEQLEIGDETEHVITSQN